MTVPYGSPAASPVLPVGALQLESRPDGTDALTVALPVDVDTAGVFSIHVQGYDFFNQSYAEAMMRMADAAVRPTDVFHVHLDADHELYLTLRPARDRAPISKLSITMTQPSALISVMNDHGSPPALLARFSNPWASAEVRVDSVDEALTTAEFSDIMWNFKLTNVFSETQDFVYLLFKSPMNVTNIETNCNYGVAVTLLPSEQGEIKFLIQGLIDRQTSSCNIVTTLSDSQTSQAVPYERVLLSTDDVTYQTVSTPSKSPLLLSTDDYSLSPTSPLIFNEPTAWQLVFAALQPQQGDTITFHATSGSFSYMDDQVTCVNAADGTPAFACVHVGAQELTCTALEHPVSPCTMTLTMSDGMRTFMSFRTTVSLSNRPFDNVDYPLTIYMPQVIQLYAFSPRILSDAPLQAGKRLDVTVDAALERLHAGKQVTLRFFTGALLGAEEHSARLSLYGDACTTDAGEPFCDAAVTYETGYILLTLTMRSNVPTKENYQRTLLRLPLYFSATGVLPTTMDILQNNLVLTSPIAMSVAPAPVAQATLSALIASFVEEQTLMLEAASSLRGLVRVAGLGLAGATELTLRNCGEDGVAGTASVDGEGVITIDADAVSFVSGSTCTVVLPAAATSASDWLTVSTADGDCDFPSSRPDHAVTVTPPSAIVTWADYPLRFQFPRLQLTSEHMFGFLADFTVANPSASSDAACSIVTAPRGAPLTVRAVVSVEPSDDLARPYRYTVSAALPDGYLTRFASVDCTLPLRVGPLSEDHDYSLVVATIGPEEHPALARVPLGKPQLEPLPSVAIELVDTIRIDFVLTQIAFSADESLQIAPSTDRFDLFTLLRCDDAYTNDVHTLTFPLDVPLSLEPVRLHCTALMAPQANATAVTFPSHPHLPDAHMPTLQKPHPAVTAIAVSNSLRVTVSSYEAKSLVLKLQRPADKRRISRVWSPDCSFPATTYQPADWLRFYPVLSTEWVIYPRSDGQPRTCTIYADFLYTAGDGTTLDIGMLELVEDRRTLLAVAVPVLEAVLPDVAEIDLFTASDMTFSTRVAVDHTFKSTIEVTDAWAQLVGDTDAADRFYLADGTSLYASDRGRLLLSPPQYGTVVTDIAPYIGAWPLHPETSRLSLYMDGVEYPGTLAPPPLTSAIIIRQPHSARGDGAYAIETTFAAPSLLRPTLYASLELEHLPITATRCSVEGNALDLDISPYRPPRVYIPIHWSQLPTQGAVPLSLPHVTLRCVLRLADEETVFAAGALQFDISVHNDLGELGRATAASLVSFLTRYLLLRLAASPSWQLIK
jgi:hypothetical protein